MAVLSKVDIGNLALSNVGEQSVIESFEEETTPARQVALWYDRMRRQALEYHNWSFARKRQMLASHPDPIPLNERWHFRYVYPADCLKFREIENPLGPDADAIPFTIESSDNGLEKTILTNVEEATGIYTFDQIMAWTKADIQQLNESLSLEDRISRDQWVKQARQLAKQKKK